MVMKAGATSMKVSGAGGGGFIMIFVQSRAKTCSKSRVTRVIGWAGSLILISQLEG